MNPWSRLIIPQQRRFRRKRAYLLRQMFPQIAGATVVDVGGSLPFWNEVGDVLKPARVIIYNTSKLRMEMAVDNRHGVETHVYDGTRLPLADGEADFVLCNSVIEHVPPEARANLAAEIRRVGKAYAVQTPSPRFPIELHFLLPFAHWLPRRIARKLVRISPFQLIAKVDAQAYFDQTRLLPEAELAGYFPGARIVTERLLGIPKSMIAVMPAPPQER